MASERDSFSDLAYLVNSRFSGPEFIEQEHEDVAGHQEDVDAGESPPESAVLPRESIFGSRPPVPPKDTRPNTEIYELAAEPLGYSIQIMLDQLGNQHHEDPQKLQDTLTSEPQELQATTVHTSRPQELQVTRISQPQEVQDTRTKLPARQPSAKLPELQIRIPTSKFRSQKKAKLSSIKYRLHPLMISPPSPVPTQILQMLNMPQRPARSASILLPAQLTRNTDLTTNLVQVLDPERPQTAESYRTQPHTRYNSASRVKYGRGKHAATELVPQPSDDPRDPLNWQTWRKELHLYALLVSVALCNVMKTALVSVNAVLAERLAVSYVAVSALTGVPLMLSAVTGLAGCTAAKIWGRRPVYLMSTVFIFIGLVWNTKITTSYSHFMAARIFQGLGWGAFDTMVLGSIIDTYFEHERCRKTAIYRIVSVATTWGPPLLGGLTSQAAGGPTLAFQVLAILQVLSIPLLVLFAPESMYNRSPLLWEKPTAGWTPRTGWSSLGLQSSSRFQRLPAWARGKGTSAEKAVQYVRDVGPPKSYPGPTRGVVDASLVLQTFFALITPTTVLVFLSSFLPHSLLWGLLFSLSGLFARPPFDLFPATVGALVATPFILSTAAVAVLSLWPAWSRTHTAFRPTSTHLLVLAGGAALSFIGILTFGLYVSPRLNEGGGGDPGLRFAALSFVLGLLAAGAYVLDAPRKPLIRRSTHFTSPNLAVGLRNEADMDAGVSTWRTLLAGVFAMATPAAVVASSAGVKSTGIVVAVVQLVVAGAVGAVWYVYDDSIRKLDGRVLGCVDLGCLLSPRSLRSFFEADG